MTTQTQDATTLFFQFFQKSLPLFPPRLESIITDSDLDQLRGDRFRYTLSVDAMVLISHMIEDAAAQSMRPVQLHVCFQYLSRLQDQYERYSGLTSKLEGLWLYAVSDDRLPNWKKTTFIDLSGHPFVDYWFIIAYGAGVSMTLLAEEKKTELRQKITERVYEGLYTFDEQIAYKVLSLLHMNFPDKVPVPIPPELL
ncbi:MAG: DICT sensory domain-containing protein [Anaerolineales bacterium]